MIDKHIKLIGEAGWTSHWVCGQWRSDGTQWETICRCTNALTHWKLTLDHLLVSQTGDIGRALQCTGSQWFCAWCSLAKSDWQRTLVKSPLWPLWKQFKIFMITLLEFHKQREQSKLSVPSPSMITPPRVICAAEWYIGRAEYTTSSWRVRQSVIPIERRRAL